MLRNVDPRIKSLDEYFRLQTSIDGFLSLPYMLR